MELHRANLTKSGLATLTQERRTAILLLGHALNEINVQQKLLILSMNTEAPEGACGQPGVESIVQAGQTLILLRGLIGQCSDAWELFRSRVERDRDFGTRAIHSLPEEAITALKRLRQDFSGDGLLTQVRNKIARHYCDRDNLIEECFQALPDDEPWDFYLSETCANTFFYASELVVTGAAIRLAGGHNANGLSVLCSRTIQVARDISRLFNELIASFVVNGMPHIEATPFEIRTPRKASELSLPFYLEEDDLRQARSSERSIEC